MQYSGSSDWIWTTWDFFSNSTVKVYKCLKLQLHYGNISGSTWIIKLLPCASGNRSFCWWWMTRSGSWWGSLLHSHRWLLSWSNFLQTGALIMPTRVVSAHTARWPATFTYIKMWDLIFWVKIGSQPTSFFLLIIVVADCKEENSWISSVSWNSYKLFSWELEQGYCKIFLWHLASRKGRKRYIFN